MMLSPLAAMIESRKPLCIASAELLVSAGELNYTSSVHEKTRV